MISGSRNHDVSSMFLSPLLCPSYQLWRRIFFGVESMQILYVFLLKIASHEYHIAEVRPKLFGHVKLFFIRAFKASARIIGSHVVDTATFGTGKCAGLARIKLKPIGVTCEIAHTAGIAWPAWTTESFDSDHHIFKTKMVGVAGFEPAVSCSQSRRLRPD